MDISSLDKIVWPLLDAQAIGVVLVDPNGIILFGNETVARDWRKSPGEMPGTCIWSIDSKAIKDHHKILFNQVVEIGQPITARYQDQGHWKQVVISPFKGDEHLPDCYAICIVDISQQVETEERLKQVLLELITVQEDERRRISQDLHDDVGQKMTALLFELRLIRETVEKKQPISLQDIDSVIRNTETTIKHVRQIFYQLYPPSLSKMPLPKVLAAFCSTFNESNNLHVDFGFQEDFPELPDNIATVFYRFVQEGLTNVAKHARASSVWINLDYEDGDLSISLEDNGQGFDLMDLHEGFGLHGIRERFLMLGGSIDIESAPGKGTRLFGAIPFNVGNN